jgi:DNA invertase Pin-like site-specific DNA recombinase
VSPIYGYARVSSIDQGLSLQRAALKATGATIIRAEKVLRRKPEGPQRA